MSLKNKLKDLVNVEQEEEMVTRQINLAGHVGDFESLGQYHVIKRVEPLSETQYELVIRGYYDCAYLQGGFKEK